MSGRLTLTGSGGIAYSGFGYQVMQRNNLPESRPVGGPKGYGFARKPLSAEDVAGLRAQQHAARLASGMLAAQTRKRIQDFRSKLKPSPDRPGMMLCPTCGAAIASKNVRKHFWKHDEG